MKILFILPALVFLQCENVNKNTKGSHSNHLPMRIHHCNLRMCPNEQEMDLYQHEEVYDSNPFIDSTSIGDKGRYKIEIRAVHLNNFEDSLYLKLFKKKNGDWDCLQRASEYSDWPFYFSPNFEDFNKDGWNDLTLITGDAARASNVVQTLFIFDPKKERFITISNSKKYPNLRYNSALDCIDAWLVYGGSSSVFLRLSGDSLIEFAKVSHDDLSRNVYLIDEKGNRKLLESTQLKEDCYTRYCNYNPVEVCSEW